MLRGHIEEYRELSSSSNIKHTIDVLKARAAHVNLHIHGPINCPPNGTTIISPLGPVSTDSGCPIPQEAIYRGAWTRAAARRRNLRLALVAVDITGNVAPMWG